MITYKTQITSMKYVPIDKDNAKVVINITWNRYATEGQYSVARTFSTSYTIKDVDPSKFIPYEDLTEEMVVGWVESSVNLPEVDLGMASQIADQQAVPTVTTFPWNTPPVPPVAP